MQRPTVRSLSSPIVTQRKLGIGHAAVSRGIAGRSLQNVLEKISGMAGGAVAKQQVGNALLGLGVARSVGRRFEQLRNHLVPVSAAGQKLDQLKPCLKTFP